MTFMATNNNYIGQFKPTTSLIPDTFVANKSGDAQEFLRILFEAVKKQLEKDGHKPRLVHQLYEFELQDYVKCLNVSKHNAC